MAERALHPSALPAISVVIPSYGRGELLVETLRRCRACAGPVSLELVVIDDGSRDDTPQRLATLAEEMPELVWRSVPNGGPGAARNLGASLAKHEIVLFLGDDMQPENDGFFLAHAELHGRHPSRGFAVVGKVIWPNRPDSPVNFVMAHVQGRGGQQFGYADLDPYSFLDWRFFYTANVSVKRTIVDDWQTEGFSSAFTRYGYEDGEFAYRMMKQREPMRLLYAPTAIVSHHHPLDADAFLSRQLSAGMMARVFLDLHADPELPELLGVARVQQALGRPVEVAEGILAADLLAMVEGVKSWVRVADRMQRLGSQWWHDDLLRGAFALCYQQGFVFASSSPGANVGAACWLMLDDFARAMQRAVQVEIAGSALGRWDLSGLFQLAVPAPVLEGVPSGRPRSERLRRLFVGGPERLPRLREWVKARPRLAAAFRRLRRRLTGVGA
ncbi:MAG: glycosyltransferase [Deltaproteobacteria bacterium]|nr:glycosyltransferase [Deltaproteobacteria bacterium]